ncbi:MAG: VWA domain-containing protein [Phycisphaerales bacterium]
MSFLHPLILTAGLLAVSIPIIIHFIRRRRRPIEWAAMRFLQDALRKRRRRLRLEQLLLLLTRCLLVALLAIAIARPTSHGGSGSQLGKHVLVIDNSIASAWRDAAGVSELERSLDAAREHLRTLDPSQGDSVGVVTMGSPGESLVWPPSPDLDAARRALDRIKSTDSRASIAALREAIGSLNEDENESRLNVDLFSSWQGVNPVELFAEANIAADSVRILGEFQSEDVRSNAGISSMTVTTPTVVGSSLLAPQTRVQGTVTRTGKLDAETVGIELIAYPGGAIAGTTSARFETGETETNWTAGIEDSALIGGRGGRVSVIAKLEDDANPNDNSAGVVLARRRELRVGVVERLPIRGDVTPGTWVLAALSPDDRAGIDSFRIDPASLRSIPAGSVDALFVLEPDRVSDAGWSRITELLDRGGLVVITPGSSGATLGWSERLSSLVSSDISINTDAGLREDRIGLQPQRPSGLLESLGSEFSDLIGTVQVSRRLMLNYSDNATVAMFDETNDPFAIETPGRNENGTCIVFASAFDISWTDLPARPIFLPIVQEIARRGSGRGLDTIAIAGQPGANPPTTLGVDRWIYDEEISGEESPIGTPGSLAGVRIGVGIDGELVRTLVVRPDTTAAGTVFAARTELEDAMAEAFPGAEIIDDSITSASESESPRRASAWGDRLALLILTICVVFAIFEALLARIASHPDKGAA